MLFVIHAFDKKGSGPIRQEHYPAHGDFLKNHTKYGAQIVMSGPLVEDDGVTPTGSHFIIEASDRKAAENFLESDPFFKAGVWTNITVTAFLKRIG